eukprot:3662594-Rhodomonas_salina.1
MCLPLLAINRSESASERRCQCRTSHLASPSAEMRGHVTCCALDRPVDRLGSPRGEDDLLRVCGAQPRMSAVPADRAVL